MSQIWLLFLLLVMGIAWGAEFSTLKFALRGGYDEITVLTIALVLISIAYFAILLVRKSLFRMTKNIFIFLAITAMLGYVIPLLAALYAAPYLPAGIMTLIASLTPVITVSVAMLLRTERVSRLRLVAVMLGMLATVLVLAPELELPHYGAFKWMLLLGLVPLCYGVESIYVAARWPGDLDAWQVGFGEAIVALILVLPIYVIFGKSIPSSFSWDIAEIGIALFVIAGLVNIVLYFYIIQKSGGVLVSFGSFIALFAGVIWGISLFDESHGVAVWAAVIALVSAMAIVCVDTIKNQPSARTSTPR